MPEPPLSGRERESRLLDAFVQMADTLVDHYDIVDVLHELVSHCVRLLDTAAAGLLMSDQRGSLQVLACSTEQTRVLELYQIQTSEGPCWDCVHSGTPVSVADLATASDRWPRFAPRAASEGFTAVYALPMRLRRETIGALNLFRRQRNPVSDRDLQTAQALADTATIGILHERAIRRSEVLTEQLQVALHNRVLIEQAKGVLAQAGTLGMDQAFEALRGYGRRRGTRLSDVAQQLVTGAISPDTVLTDRYRSDSRN
ncbi:GAF and ANTAR domain-containing protein [Nocardia sp. NPDC050175]|uniref:GAF and ANTAR domain-containing protein n=1 Tax=Nocardia sp. NPDC050175 TaxID=3364317 RepID=UPI0037A6DAE2